MKQKLIVLSVLIFVAAVSSFLVLKEDGYFDNNKQDDAKVLSVASSSMNQVAMAQESTVAKKETVAKTVTPVKKKVTPKKKVVKKRKVSKVKHKLNLAPPVITPATAPFSAKNKHN